MNNMKKGKIWFTIYLALSLWSITSQQQTLLPYGTEKGDVMLTRGDDENVEVELQESCMFWDRNIKKFYVSHLAQYHVWDKSIKRFYPSLLVDLSIPSPYTPCPGNIFV